MTAKGGNNIDNMTLSNDIMLDFMLAKIIIFIVKYA